MRAFIFLVIFAFGFLALFSSSCTKGQPSSGVDTVRVAPPSGQMTSDRASIIEAIETAKPGDVILFAPGTYKIGPMIPVQTSDITLLGHPEGTVIRGCDPENFTDIETALLNCHGIELRGARQTVRNLTLEYTWHGLYVGCCFPANLEELQSPTNPDIDQPGGHLIEGNTFRYAPNGMRVIGKTAEPVVVRNNRFVDVYHAIGINGGSVQFLNNTLTVEDPEKIPISHHAGDVINMLPFSSMLDLNQAPLSEDFNSCMENIIEGNTIDGYTDGIGILIVSPNSGCRENIIRNNTIRVKRARITENWMGILADTEDSTLVGVPIRLQNAFTADSSNTYISNNLIENNRILGAEGVGLELLNASGNVIRNNTFSDIIIRQPFPGNVVGDHPRWEAANGSAIWLSPQSAKNEITGNQFNAIEQYSLYIESDSNSVAINAGDSVRNQGNGNF